MKWWDECWNFITGCTPVSEACTNCYAAREAGTRLKHLDRYAGLAKKHGDRYAFTGEVRLHEDLLNRPLRWRRPRSIFVCNTSDLFHEDVPFEFINQAWETMSLAHWHSFLILTKRPERMHEFVTEHLDLSRTQIDSYPLSNVWLGVTVESQEHIERAAWLASTPAARRFISAEPLLGEVTLMGMMSHFDCVIAGGESGKHARPTHPDWALWLRDQCDLAGKGFIYKQWGEWVPYYIPNWGWQGEPLYTFSEDGMTMRRVGRKAAGNDLDGRKYEELPWRK